jgi:DNA repair protein RecN (Recombination protein N)
MLRELRIRNLAIVEDAVIPFSPGLNVLTGSTGAGKSIILTAVELLSGARGRRSLVRTGASNLTVEGVFSVDEGWPLRDSLGMTPGETDLSIKRELTADGRSRVWINGMTSTVSACQSACAALFELYGQHRQQELLDAATHVLFLDAWGGYEEQLVRAMEAIARFNDLSERARELRRQEDEHRQREDFLRFQLRELEELKLESGIDRMLESRINQIRHRHRYVSSLEECRDFLGGDGSAIDKLQRASRLIESIIPIDEGWKSAAQDIDTARISVQEVSRRIEHALAAAEEPDVDLESLQERLAGIQRVCRKHATDCDGLIARRDEMRRILASLEHGSDALLDAERERERLAKALVPMLAELSRLRRERADALDREVTAELHRLGMKGAVFRTEVEVPQNSALQDGGLEIHLSPRGWDRVEFRIRTNIGEEMHPLADVASGGELSRITLVLKKLQVEEKGVPTLIFDEIDSGLGADLGGIVAERLSRLSRAYQIVCITHLPQVAAKASLHLKVSKQVREERTAASAKILSGEERIGEIARMLGGTGELREKLAAELLAEGSAPVAQLDRAPASGAGCRRFKSSRARSS